MDQLLGLRLVSQQIDPIRASDPVGLARDLLAIQAQDYGQAKWALGSRLHAITDADIDELVFSGKLIRTWFMRGTYHLVAAEDVSWLMSLTVPRVQILIKGRLKELGIDDALKNKCYDLFVKNLTGKHFSRKELSTLLTVNGVSVEGMRLLHIIQVASIEGIICASKKLDGDFGFTLFDEWIPSGIPLSKEEAENQLAYSFFTSRGPASIADFQWWSGLPLKDCQRALASVEKEFSFMEVNGQRFWFKESILKPKETVHLLSGFDEYLMAYKDRSLFLDPTESKKVITANGLFGAVFLVNGKVAGTWKRVIKPKFIEVKLEPFTPISPFVRSELDEELNRYSGFMAKEVRLTSAAS